MDDQIGKKLGAEFIGTFLLVFGGCGSAIFAAAALGATKGILGIGGAELPAAGVVNYGIGYLGVALAFGLTVVCGAYGLGHVSGGHFTRRCRSASPPPSGSPGRTCRPTS